MSGKKEPAQSLAAVGGQRQETRDCASVSSNITRIYAQSQIVGEVRAKTFYKSVRSSRHMLRRPQAWALDCQSLRDAEAAGAERVELHDKDTGDTYTASIAHVWRFGFEFDRKHGAQIGLVLERWTLHRPGQAAQLVFAF